MRVYCVLTFLFVLVYGQRQATIHNANESITKAGPNYQTIADRYWYGPDGVIDFFDAINTERNDVALTVSALFANATEAALVYDAITLPACDYNPDPQYYYTNETAAQQFICCHLTVVNNPGIVAFLSRLEMYFTGQETATHLQSRVIDQLVNVDDLRAVETQAIDVRVCKDDLRINTAETLIIRAELIAKILGIVSRMYTFINARALSLSTCLLYPANVTGCAQITSPLLYTNIAQVTTVFSSTDVFFTRTCGQAALVAFDTFRSTKTSCF